MDAVVRRAAAVTRSPDLGLILAVKRCTGLRVGQVCGIRACDLDLQRATLTVVVGKSRQEKADRRTIPVAQEVVNLLRDRVVEVGVGENLLFARQDGSLLEDAVPRRRSGRRRGTSSFGSRGPPTGSGRDFNRVCRAMASRTPS
jgi:integrase